DATQSPPLPQSCGEAASMDTCEEELSGVEAVVSKLSGGGRAHLTRFRPPFGEPYQGPAPGITEVAPVVAKFAVWVGWNFDSTDSLYHGRSCAKSPCPTGQGIASVVEGLIGQAPGQGASYGILLMHGTFPWTRDAIPILFDPKTGYLATHGFKV